jgi:peptidoglycan/LPS O-acetylase OafA/YrhL
MPIGTKAQASYPSVRRRDILATASAPKAQRIPALDFTKGALVLLMVLYHWINYFIGPQWGYYRYLRFLTPSFIFITGFMVSHVYLSKYSAADPRLSKRLLTRGLKLLGVFLALNLARNFVVPLLGPHAPMENVFAPRNIFAVFVSGNLPVVGGKLVSFSILVSISYVLILSGVLMFPYKRYRYTFHFACVLLLLFISTLGMVGARSYNLEFVAIGMSGVLAGFTSSAAINSVVQHPYRLAFAYVCYTIAITLWNAWFPLLFVGVPLSVMVIYLVAASGSESDVIASEVILLGKYSLFGYISQIAMLQILSAAFRQVNLGFTALAVSFFAAVVLTIASVEVVDRARARMARVDKLYRAVFA